MSRQIKRIIEDRFINKLNNLMIWTYLNLGDTNYKIISNGINLFIVFLEKIEFINKRRK